MTLVDVSREVLSGPSTRRRESTRSLPAAKRITRTFCRNAKSPVFYWGKVVRPGGFELPTFWFVAVRSTLRNLARGVANRTKSAGWGKFSQTTFSFICFRLLHFCRRFLQFALHFRDSYQIKRKCMSYDHLRTML